MGDWKASPAEGPLTGELRPPSDKSITHRAVMLAGLAEGTSRIASPLLGADARSTMAAMEALGAKVAEAGGAVEVTGTAEPLSPKDPIDCGNAGTLIRLLAGAVCGRGVECVLDGDDSLRARPMKRIADPLNSMGARLSLADGGTPPVRVGAATGLRRIEYELPTASAQVKSAVLLAGLVAEGGAKVVEPQACRDHTELILPSFGADVRREGSAVEVARTERLTAAEIEVPADISSAAFFIAAASIVPGSDIVLRDVCVNPTRTGIIGIMRRMGADIEVRDERRMGNERVADLRVRHANLAGTEIGPGDIPAAIDELPVILAAAAAAEGQTLLHGAAELRAKESDRIAAMAAALSAVGIRASERPDGMELSGGQASGGRVDSMGDHRIAMAMAACALVASGEVLIEDCDNVATSFPGFPAAAAGIGWKVEAC